MNMPEHFRFTCASTTSQSVDDIREEASSPFHLYLSEALPEAHIADKTKDHPPKPKREKPDDFPLTVRTIQTTQSLSPAGLSDCKNAGPKM